MTRKEKRLIEQVCHEIQERYPEAKIVSRGPVPDGGSLILVHTPIEEDEIRISEEMAERCLELLLKEGVLISVSSHYHNHTERTEEVGLS